MRSGWWGGFSLRCTAPAPFGPRLPRSEEVSTDLLEFIQAFCKEQISIMATGTVKFFNAEKGYGFISREQGDDVFVHYSNIEGQGYRTLEQGQTVEFEVGPGRKGEEARNVRVV